MSDETSSIQADKKNTPVTVLFGCLVDTKSRLAAVSVPSLTHKPFSEANAHTSSRRTASAGQKIAFERILLTKKLFRSNKFEVYYETKTMLLWEWLQLRKAVMMANKVLCIL